MQTEFCAGGMTCINCQNRIEQKLKSIEGVENAAVSYTTGKVSITWNPELVTLAGIKQAVESLGYNIIDGDASNKMPAGTIAGTLLIIAALYLIMRALGIGAAASALPLAQSGMSYGMLFVLGLLTSLHCAAMCGGINLSQCLNKEQWAAGSGQMNRLAAPILYNTGRVISYTIVGALAGALGGIVTISGRLQGLVQIIAGIFMVIMGVNMLNLFPALRRFNLSLPSFFAEKRNRLSGSTAGRSPLVIGLLNGLMPCGPLQAMQIYALSTGSPLAGGISMFLFSLGTAPLMFGIGALSSMLSGAKGKAFARYVQNAGAVLVTAMGLMMFTYGWSLGGLPSPTDALNVAFTQKSVGGEIFAPLIENGVQIVNSTLSPGRYPAITVQEGIPVRWTINAPAGSINGCNNRMFIREYGIEHRFRQGENIIEFMPEKTGRFTYSCWMGMIRSNITVLAEGEAAAVAAEPDLNPAPAGVTIPTDKFALAKIEGEGRSAYQTVNVNLRDDGIEPALIIVERGVPTLWTINNNSLDAGNSRLIFPSYYTQTGINKGENVIQLLPTADFDYSTGDNVFYGFVKVVDDLNNVDLDAVKSEVNNFETLIYPDAYFEAAAQGGGGCCGG
ncbi:MAG: sulfite exporter TauE/SafE family protein [Spirochaetaceae bacterium]|jgi:sulfite exporter TauE/SafE|nr:sulfite exporter TauE/SafE family protein [Spirochaetaceae bacterium]